MTHAFDTLIKDHRKVKHIIEELQNSTAKAKRQTLLNNLKEELKIHEKIEESVVYPVLKAKSTTKDLTLEAFQEHHIIDVLLEELEDINFKDETWKAKLTVLQENLEHHISEEEEELFPKANHALSDKTLDQIAENIELEKKNYSS